MTRHTHTLLIPTNSFIETEGLERTWKLTQDKIKKEVDLQSEAKVCPATVESHCLQIFDLKLNTFGPYMFDYTRNGK